MKGEVWSDWGCPDGTSEADYSGHENWDALQWRWEFKRRKIEYRFSYHMAVNGVHEARYDKLPPLDLVWSKEFEDFVFRPSAAQSTFGLPAMPTPLFFNSIDKLRDKPELDLERRTLRLIHFNKIRRGDWQIQDVFPLFGVGITFDMELPIAQQLKGLEGYLEGMWHHAAAKPFQKSHPENWIFALRTLDARAAGLSWAQCAQAINPTHVTSGVSASRAYFKAGERLKETM